MQEQIEARLSELGETLRELVRDYHEARYELEYTIYDVKTLQFAVSNGWNVDRIRQGLAALEKRDAGDELTDAEAAAIQYVHTCRAQYGDANLFRMERIVRAVDELAQPQQAVAV